MNDVISTAALVFNFSPQQSSSPVFDLSYNAIPIKGAPLEWAIVLKDWHPPLYCYETILMAIPTATRNHWIIKASRKARRDLVYWEYLIFRITLLGRFPSFLGAGIFCSLWEAPANSIGSTLEKQQPQQQQQ